MGFTVVSKYCRVGNELKFDGFLLLFSIFPELFEVLIRFDVYVMRVEFVFVLFILVLYYLHALTALSYQLIALCECGIMMLSQPALRL